MRADLGNPEFIDELVNAKVTRYTVKNGCEEGDNVAGSLKKIRATTKNGDELHLIFKIIPENSPQWIIDGKIFRTEHAVYRTLVSNLREFASSQGFNYEPPVPKYYKGFNDDKNDYICLEDIRPLGFIMPDKAKSLSLSEMNLVVRELAKFHAVSYAMITKKGEQIFETGDMAYFKLAETPLPEELMVFRSMIEVYYAETTKLMKKRRPDVGSRMEKFVPNTWEIFERTKKINHPVHTIIHFDLWVNNLLIKYVNEEPSEVRFIDFQFVQRGNILLDLQYLIFTSTTPAFRKEHLVTILNSYFDHFSASLESLKCALPRLTRGELVNQFYKECFLPGFVHMTFAIPLQLGFLGSDPEDNNKNESEPDMAADVHRQYLKSPLALARLDVLADEMIEMGVL